MKRPAVKRPANVPDWRAVPPPGGPEQPQWACHWVEVLGDRLGDLMSNTLTSGTTLNVWSDCGGMGTEMFALADITAAIQAKYGVLMQLNLHCFCDSEKHCRDMAVANHAPTHVSDDINNRDFDDGTFECSLCADTHAMPTQGLDIYVCCFPCGPWSKSGKRLGFNDADGQLCWQAIASIKYMKPNLYVMENVVAIGDRDELGQSDLEVIKAHMVEALPGYTHLVITGIGPTMNGYPVRKSRTLLIGGRSEVIALWNLWNFYGISHSESNSLPRCKPM